MLRVFDGGGWYKMKVSFSVSSQSIFKGLSQNFATVIIYTRRQNAQINQDRMIFGDFSVNSKPISFKFCKGDF